MMDEEEEVYTPSQVIPVVIFDDDEETVPIRQTYRNEHVSNDDVFVELPIEEPELPIKPIAQPDDYSFWIKHPTLFFLRENLFSELTNDWQRTLARRNLGISDSQEFKWGSVTGNLANQLDLVNFINDLLNTTKSELETDISKKANSESPALTGKPTSVTPDLSSNDNLIATTEWVMLKLAEAGTGGGGSSPILLMCNPASAMIGTTNDVTLSWSYSGLTVRQQTLNGVEYDLSVKSASFTGVNKNTTYTLRLVAPEGIYTKSVTFELVNPTLLYSVSDNFSTLLPSLDSSVEVNASTNKYVYIGTLLLNPSFSVNGFVGGFSKVGTHSYLNLNYDIYRSTYNGLGTIKVTVS